MGFNFIISREHFLLKNLLDGHLQSWLHKEKEFSYILMKQREIKDSQRGTG